MPGRWSILSLFPLLMAACAAAEPGEACLDSRSNFAHAGRVPRAVAGVGEHDPGAVADHLHEAPVADAAPPEYRPGEPAIGPVALGDGVVEAGWRPARAAAVPPWTLADAPPAALDDQVSAAWIREALTRGRSEATVHAEGLLWWEGPVPDGAAAPRLDPNSGLARVRRLSGSGLKDMRCVDRVCSVLRPEARGLGGERFVVALAGGRLDAVLARWRGDGPTLSAFLAAASRERSRAQHAELGEILSIEEALRLEVAYHRLSALVPLHPDNPFVPYFMARNAAARHLTEPALAGLEALAADPTARALAARALAERHAEWEPLRSHPRYIAAQAGLMRQIPNEPELFAAWLVRHRASAPHLEVAVLPGGPPWYTLAPHLEAFARLSPAAAQGPDGEARAVATPDGPLVLQLGRDAAGRLGLRGLSAPTASGSSPPAPPRP